MTGLVELITALGDTNLKFQMLDQAGQDYRLTKHGTKVSFLTDGSFDLGGMEQCGIIVWVDRAKLKEVWSKLKADKNGQV